ncbi:MAG TPA: hypothetical protein VLJ37_05790, partial [bacterium]|nr:hypothetical protein [bacterium]
DTAALDARVTVNETAITTKLDASPTGDYAFNSLTAATAVNVTGANGDATSVKAAAAEYSSAVGSSKTSATTLEYKDAGGALTYAYDSLSNKATYTEPSTGALFSHNPHGGTVKDATGSSEISVPGLLVKDGQGNQVAAYKDTGVELSAADGNGGSLKSIAIPSLLKLSKLDAGGNLIQESTYGVDGAKVAGTIETTGPNGGIKFPDGSVQTKAADTAAVQASIDAEITRSTAADAAFDGRLTTDETSIATNTTEIGIIKTVNTTQDANIAANTAEIGIIKTVNTTQDANIAANTADIVAETNARTAADTNLQGQIATKLDATAPAGGDMTGTFGNLQLVSGIVDPSDIASNGDFTMNSVSATNAAGTTAVSSTGVAVTTAFGIPPAEVISYKAAGKFPTDPLFPYFTVTGTGRVGVQTDAPTAMVDILGFAGDLVPAFAVRSDNQGVSTDLFKISSTGDVDMGNATSYVSVGGPFLDINSRVGAHDPAAAKGFIVSTGNNKQTDSSYIWQVEGSVDGSAIPQIDGFAAVRQPPLFGPKVLTTIAAADGMAPYHAATKGQLDAALAGVATKTYVDSQDAATLASAATYTDAGVFSAKAYTDTSATAVRQEFADADAAVTLAYKAADTANLTAANGYTDQTAANLTLAYKAEDAANLAAANAHTDTSVANLQGQIDGKVSNVTTTSGLNVVRTGDDVSIDLNATAGPGLVLRTAPVPSTEVSFEVQSGFGSGIAVGPDNISLDLTTTGVGAGLTIRPSVNSTNQTIELALTAGNGLTERQSVNGADRTYEVGGTLTGDLTFNEAGYKTSFLGGEHVFSTTASAGGGTLLGGTRMELKNQNADPDQIQVAALVSNVENGIVDIANTEAGLAVINEDADPQGTGVFVGGLPGSTAGPWDTGISMENVTRGMSIRSTLEGINIEAKGAMTTGLKIRTDGQANSSILTGIDLTSPMFNAVDFGGNPIRVNGTRYTAQQFANALAGGVTSVTGGSGILVTPASGTGDVGLRALTGAGLGIDLNNAVGITADAVTTDMIANGTITGADVGTFALTGANIKPNSLDGSQLMASSITTDKIAFQTITADNIALNTLTGDQIKLNSVSAGVLTDLSIGTSKLNDSAVTSAKIADGNVTNADLAANAVTGINIAAGAVDTAKIADQTITGADVALFTLTGDNIKFGTLLGAHLAVNTIGTANLADDTVTSIKIADGNVSAVDMAQNTLDFAQIADVLTVDGQGLLIKTGGPTGGQVALDINNTTGFVGIGTAAPDSLLHVKNPSDDGAIVRIGGNSTVLIEKKIRFGDGNFVEIGETTTDDTLEIKGTRVYMNAAGGVGIGTASPTQKLTISGGHIRAADAPPVFSTCGAGSGSVDPTSSSVAGTVSLTAAATARTCTFTWAAGTGYSQTPHCVASISSVPNGTAATPFAFMPSTAGFNLFTTATNVGQSFSYMCFTSN